MDVPGESHCDSALHSSPSPMSSLERDADSFQFRVVIPNTGKLPPNPLLVAAPLQRRTLERALAPPSVTATTDTEVSHVPSSEKALRNRLLVFDQRSFLTGSAVADLQAAYIINTVRHNELRKQAVEAYLTQQRIQPLFRLDNVSNAILLESSLHTQWDLYGTFCFVPAENDLLAMLESLKNSNEMWKQDAQDAVRPLDVSKEPFCSPKWDVIVLHPYAMLPEGMPLAITQDRPFFDERSGSIPPFSHLNWTWWITAGDTLRSVPEGTFFEPFAARNLRSDFRAPPIASLAMVMNAHSKLQTFLRDFAEVASTRVIHVAQLISELVTEIFFVPGAYDDVGPKMYSLLLAQKAQSHRSMISGDHLQPMQPVASGADFSWVSRSTSREKEDPDAAVPPSDDEEVNEAPETPESDGLTDSEFRIVSAQANNPHLDAKRRADAAMMMLFGTPRFVDPYVHRAPKV
ncbi:unnamed protein product [Cyclocybe aegerita]|uniref:HNH nuclease domain-containing protein n=1 Tax=Cyclocybe aegerita TaxID=1973307 RepID=A0A8S0X6B8_CYCAE|nr:unnamed protein product [Cyclocybe aegerita]